MHLKLLWTRLDRPQSTNPGHKAQTKGGRNHKYFALFDSKEKERKEKKTIEFCYWAKEEKVLSTLKGHVC